MREVIWAVEVSLTRIERDTPDCNVVSLPLIKECELSHYTGALPEDKARALYAACDLAFHEASR